MFCYKRGGGVGGILQKCQCPMRQRKLIENVSDYIKLKIPDN